MATDRRYKTFTYKKAQCARGSDTLQSKLTSALSKKRKHAIDRCQPLDNDAKELRGVEEILTQNTMLFGRIVDFSPGSHQPTIGANLRASALKITLTAPPKSKEYLEKYLFFGVKDNHVVVIQSTIRSKQFEIYLNWLLQSVSPPNQKYFPTYLVDLPPIEIRDVKVEKVKSIELRPGRQKAHPGGPTRPEAGSKPQSQSPAVEERHWIVKEEKTDSTDANFIRDIINRFAPNNRSLLASRSFSEALELGRVRAKVLLEVNGSVKDDPVPFMDEFAAAVSHADEEDLDYIIRMKDGPDITPDKLKYRENILVTCDDGMPLVAEVRSIMSGWLDSALESKRVY